MQLSARASVGFSMTVARVSVVKRARLTHGVASSPARQCPSSRCPLVARASEREQSLDRDSDTLKADAELRMTEIIAQVLPDGPPAPTVASIAQPRLTKSHRCLMVCCHLFCVA